MEFIFYQIVMPIIILFLFIFIILLQAIRTNQIKFNIRKILQRKKYVAQEECE